MKDLFSHAKAQQKAAQRQQPTQEHGDWRRLVDKPHEVEHLVNPPLGVWKKLQLRAEYLDRLNPMDLLRSEAAHTGSWIDEDEYDPIRGHKRVRRILLSLIFLLPISLIMAHALFLQLHAARGIILDSSFWTSIPVWYTLLGAVIMGSLHFLQRLTPLFGTALMYIYVLGHEATHALTAIFCIQRVRSFKVGLDGGYIETDEDNVVVALAPYFVPLWLLLWCTGIWLINLIFPFSFYEQLFYAGLGGWLLFHVYWTIWVIPREQPDFLENGLLFSAVFIIAANMMMLVFILCAFDVISFKDYLRSCLQSAQTFYQLLT